MMLFTVVVLKVGVLREEVEDYLTAELLARFSYDDSLLTWLLLAFLFFSLGLAGVFLTSSVASASTVRTIRDATGQPISPGLDKDMKWNLFISHIWSSAQACALGSDCSCILNC